MSSFFSWSLVFTLIISNILISELFSELIILSIIDKTPFHLAKTGDRVNAIKGFAQIRKKCHMTTGTKLDLIFNQLKLALFYSDNFVEEKEEEKNDEEDKKADEMEDFKKDKVEKKMNSVAAKKAEDNKKCVKHGSEIVKDLKWCCISKLNLFSRRYVYLVLMFWGWILTYLFQSCVLVFSVANI